MCYSSFLVALHGTVYLTTGLIGKKNIKKWNRICSFLDMDQIGELVEAGWDMQCHSATHENFKEMTPKGIKQEII